MLRFLFYFRNRSEVHAAIKTTPLWRMFVDPLTAVPQSLAFINGIAVASDNHIVSDSFIINHPSIFCSASRAVSDLMGIHPCRP